MWKHGMQIYLPIAELPLGIFTLLALSAGVGFISGLFGIGGGFLLTPLLIFLGIPPAVAVATSAAQITAASTTGVLTAWRKRMLDLKLGGVLIAGGVLGTGLGVLFFNVMRRLGQLELIVTLGYVSLFSVVGSLMLVESLRALSRRRRAGHTLPLTREGARHPLLGLPLRMRFPRSGLYASVIPIMGLAGVIGFVGAVLGIGGGFMLVPALLYLLRIRTSIAVGTSLFQILVTMAAATLFHALTNQSVDIVLALLLIIGGSAGAQFGARAGQNMRADSFRLLLALLVLGVGMRFGVELFLQPDEPFSIVRQGAPQ
jgi:uncharacterized protein